VGLPNFIRRGQPGGLAEENERKWPQKGDFAGRMSFAIDSMGKGMPKGTMQDYQEALVTPGINPISALSRKVNRDNLNFLKNPLALPVNVHLLRRRIGQVSLFILFKFKRAFSLSSSLRERSRLCFLSICLLSHASLTSLSRFFCFSTEDFFAMVILF
jgi:hypothetical protein